MTKSCDTESLCCLVVAMSLIGTLHILFGSVLVFYAWSFNDIEDDTCPLFRSFIKKYNKTYVPGTMEYMKRQRIFKESLARAEWLNKHRSNEAEAIYGITQFSDMTPQEFEEYILKGQLNTTRGFVHEHSAEEIRRNSILRKIPKKVDWREKKVVTAVRNQDKCGACWAFSTIETVETMYALETGVLEEWSVQQVIDCASKPNEGCEGGDTCSAVEWLAKNNVSLVLAKNYPFADDTGMCKFVKSEKTVRVASNFTCDNFVGLEEEMLYLLAYHGPLIVAVDASGWQDYLGGIIQFHCDDDVNHAVQIVGYDLTGDIHYYIVRNSWGTSFGNDGYLYIAIGHNLCGIANEVSSLDILL